MSGGRLVHNLTSRLISIRSAIEPNEVAPAGPAQVALGAGLASSSSSSHDDDHLAAGDQSTWAQLMAALFAGRSGWLEANWLNLLLAAFLVLLMLSTAVGNLFVIVAILIERNLRTIGNYLVLSLAIADLLVALLVMPLAGIYQILDRWTLGVLLCDIWTSADVFCCTASILHLLAIALDRYWAVTRVDYIRCQRNERRILAMILFVWAAACVISLAPVFGWKDAQFEWRITQAKECLISQDVGYQIFATFTTFYFPLILTLIFYWKIYQVARKRIRRKLDNRLVKVNNKLQQHPSKFPGTSKAAATLMGATEAAKGTGSLASKGNKLCPCRCHEQSKMMTDKSRRDAAEFAERSKPGAERAPEAKAAGRAEQLGGQSKCNKSNHNGHGNDNDIERDNVVVVAAAAAATAIATTAADDDKRRRPAGQSKGQEKAASSEHIATFAGSSMGSSSAPSASSTSSGSSPSSSSSSLGALDGRKLKKCARHSDNQPKASLSKVDACPGCLWGANCANYGSSNGATNELVQPASATNCCAGPTGDHYAVEPVHKATCARGHGQRQQVADGKRAHSLDLADSNSSNLSRVSLSTMANKRPGHQKQNELEKSRKSSEACEECCVACCCHDADHTVPANLTIATNLSSINTTGQSAVKGTQEVHESDEKRAEAGGKTRQVGAGCVDETRPSGEGQKVAGKQESLVSINEQGQVYCDIVVVDEQMVQWNSSAAGSGEGVETSTGERRQTTSTLSRLLLMLKPNWRRLMSKTTMTTTAGDKMTANIPSSTILVDERGQSSLVAGRANGSAAQDTCRQCKCPLQVSDMHQRHLTHNAFSLDEVEIKRASSSAKEAAGMVIAVSTANIAVTTSGREPKGAGSGGAPQQTSASAVQQSIEGVESKRERKAAKTLAIITGVFVMCWLPFFVMAITMPLLQLRPHKYVFAFLLWLGYANSMLNPIIYTIFSPDFRKAFNRLLCGLEDDTTGKRGASKQQIAANKRHKNNLDVEWNHLDPQQTGYLGQLRHQLGQIHPILAKLTCCCCCCSFCDRCCHPSPLTGSSWSSTSPTISTGQQASRFLPAKVSRLTAAADDKGSPQHLLLANNVHNSFDVSRCTTMDTTSVRTNSSSGGQTPVRPRPQLPAGPSTPSRQPAGRALLASRPFSSITNDF